MTSLFAKSIRGALIACFLTSVGSSSLAQKASPFAIPGRPPPPAKIMPSQLPQRNKITPPVLKLPSPYELRGCYNFDGKWYFALYHKSTRESAWLSLDENSTSAIYAGDVSFSIPRTSRLPTKARIHRSRTKKSNWPRRPRHPEPRSILPFRSPAKLAPRNRFLL